MIVDFTIKPDYEGGGKWDLAEVRINTKRGAEAYNEYFSTEKKLGDTFVISKASYYDFQMMQDMSRLSSIFG